uniref:PICK1 PDZ DOMAIN FUSED TO THE C10 DAT LIGAND n=1 Tax=Rattus norvegicus TaxID=10116 RepID=UPI00034F232E|nr:Chain A, PICK1 PDZ DOMAIN FUSED TO THE C10 DAT LIGAND [Rattus norvegicus]
GSPGIPVPGKVTLQKDAQNLIGISIGGGAQYCPCLYIVQVFDNTPAALDGTVAAGDEITGVNGRSIKGKTKVEVAKMIQEVKGEVTIHYNKLQADPKQLEVLFQGPQFTLRHWLKV